MMAYGYNIKKTGKDWEFSSVHCTAWTPRGGRRKAQAKARQREQRRMLFSLSMATGIFAYPYGISEAEIVDKNGVKVNPTDNVYNIDPQRTNGDFAYNRFSKFELGQGYIANLKFDTATLANLVHDKIIINGIVNAVRNGQIDGHLMFLSPNGIAVGASGVINAGQFTGLVPSAVDFEKLYNSANPNTDITQAAIEKLSYAAGVPSRSAERSTPTAASCWGPGSSISRMVPCFRVRRV